MMDLNPFKKLAALKRAGFTTALFLLAGWLNTSAHAGVVFNSLYSFTGTNDGANPVGGLVQGNDGNLYGTTEFGGTNGIGYGSYGTVYKISTNGVLTSLYSFKGYGDGANPETALVQGRDGNFYGTTYDGGTNGNGGTVFKISANGAYTNLYSFGDEFEGAPNGLVQGTDGYFYGTTLWGGTYFYENGYAGFGTVFRISTNGSLTSLHSFGSIQDDYYDETVKGANPQAGLVQGTDGYFYGTTAGGGTNDDGTVFKISRTGAFTSLSSFDGANGETPYAGLVQGRDGNFYGTTVNSTNNAGNIFKISTNGTLTGLYSFTGGSDGSIPFAGLVQGNDGSFYGVTAGIINDSYHYGEGSTIFKINGDGSDFTTLYTFSANTNSFGTNSDGVAPHASLILVGNTLYGTTTHGGIYGHGTVFSLTLPVPPQLSITADGANVVLTWPANATGFNDAGFILECATNLIPPIVWQTNSTAPIVIGSQDVIINPITGSQMFFRLTQ
jgi:uncharacterized repeat protein (TIGR03803 family)